MYVELENGNYANLAAVDYVYAFNSGGTWKARTSPATGDIDGVAEATEADAQSKIRKLVHGVNLAAVT